MVIEDFVDCCACESYQRIEGRTQSEPDDCYPAEVKCIEDVPSSGACRMLLDAIHDRVENDYFRTESGRVMTAKQLQDLQGDAGMPESFRAFDFSSAWCWWVPSSYNMRLAEPFQDEKEVFDGFFL